MVPLNTPRDYMFNLCVTNSGEAKRMWRKSIKEKWNHQCAYCGSEEKLTIDHVIPQVKGGTDFITNVVCCCQSCNLSKAHMEWQEWYSQQIFYSEEKKDKILEWTQSVKNHKTYKYSSRKNIVYSKEE